VLFTCKHTQSFRDDFHAQLVLIPHYTACQQQRTNTPPQTGLTVNSSHGINPLSSKSLDRKTRINITNVARRNSDAVR